MVGTHFEKLMQLRERYLIAQHGLTLDGDSFQLAKRGTTELRDLALVKGN